MKGSVKVLSVEIDILKVDKDTVALTTGDGKQVIETVAVAYTANVKIGGCSIHGRFKFSDEFIILGEEEAKQKISELFKDFEGGKS